MRYREFHSSRGGERMRRMAARLHPGLGIRAATYWVDPRPESPDEMDALIIEHAERMR
jgi:hypothetical protein